MSLKKINMKRSWKHRFFVEILLSDVELDFLASRLTSPGVDFKEEWLSQRGKVCLSGLEDSEGLGAEINDVLALGFAVLSYQEGKQFQPLDSYWHKANEVIPKIDELKLSYVDCEWADQDEADWMDLDECPSVAKDDWR